MTLDVVTARDADTHVMDTAARVRGKWRHSVAMSNVDTESLSEYEQPLSIRECDAVIVTAHDADRKNDLDPDHKRKKLDSGRIFAIIYNGISEKRARM